MAIEETQTKYNETQLPTWIAAKDAVNRSQAARDEYCSEVQDIAEALTEYARRVFTRSRIFLTFRKEFFTVKAERAAYADMINPLFTQFEARVKSLGGTVALTGTGRVYRIPKALER